MEPTAPPVRKTAEEFAAMFAAKDDAILEHLKDILTAASISYDPETITYEDAKNSVILNYQNLLDAAGAPYDAYTAEEDYAPSATSPVEYRVYLQRLVATIP